MQTFTRARALLGWAERPALLMFLVIGTVGATCRQGSSPVWRPESQPGPFCSAMKHCMEVTYSDTRRGAIMTFVAKPGEEAALQEALKSIRPMLMSSVLPASKPAGPHQKGPLAPPVDKHRLESRKAHDGSHGGGMPSSGPAEGGRGAGSSGSGAGTSGSTGSGGGGGGGFGGATVIDRSVSEQTRAVLVDVRDAEHGGELLIVAFDESDVDDLRKNLRLHAENLTNGACEEHVPASRP